MSTSCISVEFLSGGVPLKGLLYRPEGVGPFPAIVLTHGYAFVVKFFEHHNYPLFFAKQGFVALVFDHPNTGDSEGLPRQELDPIAQQRGYSDAITFLYTLSDVDPLRIGIWGTSYSGGHVLAVGAADRRIACVVSQTPTIDGAQNLRRRFTAAQLDGQRRKWMEDRIGRFRGEAPLMVPAGSAAADNFVASLPSQARGAYVPSVTMRSQEWYSSYTPGSRIGAISPTPLLMIVCTRDQVTPEDDARAAFEAANQPKKLSILEGDHFDVYNHLFSECARAGSEWFCLHLDNRRRQGSRSV